MNQLKGFISGLFAATAIALAIIYFVKPLPDIYGSVGRTENTWFRNDGCAGILSYVKDTPTRLFTLIDDSDYTAIDFTGQKYSVHDINFGFDCVSEPQHAHDSVRLLHSLNGHKS